MTKRLGLIGGIGWESTSIYYRLINQEVRNRLGALHSAPLILNSLDFDRLNVLVKAGDWNEAGRMLGEAAALLERAGAEGIVLCSNLMHYVVSHIEAAVSVPVLHLGDAVLHELRQKGITDIGLLGTRFTVEHGFLFQRPLPHHSCRKPRIYTRNEADCERLDQIIYDELCRGLIRKGVRLEVLKMAKKLKEDGARAVVLASSELITVLKPADVTDWIFDSTELHAVKAAQWAMGEDSPWDARGKLVAGRGQA